MGTGAVPKEVHGGRDAGALGLAGRRSGVHRQTTPARAGRCAPGGARLRARAPRRAPSQRLMPTRDPPQARGSRGNPQAGPPGPGPPPASRKARPRKIVFEDELPSRTLPAAQKPVGAVPGGHKHRPLPVPDYELMYPPLSRERDRSCYVAVFRDQYGEFLELQRQVGATQAKLRQLEALLRSQPPPRNQQEALVAARVWRELDKKRSDPGFLDKQARCHYLRCKLKHIKAQIRKFDSQGDSEGSVYF
ncbi:occludin/ELL domain-containing protein 1 [Ctenodactylus gundi]